MYIAAGGSVYTTVGRAQSIESGAVRSIGQKKLRNKDPHQKKKKKKKFHFLGGFLCFSIACNDLRSTESRAEGLVFRHLHQPQQLPLSLTVPYVALCTSVFLLSLTRTYTSRTHTQRGKEGKEEQLTQVSRLSYALLPPLSAQLPCLPSFARTPTEINNTTNREQKRDERRSKKKKTVCTYRETERCCVYHIASSTHKQQLEQFSLISIILSIYS